MRMVPLLSHLGDDEVRALLDACLTEHMPAGAQVFSPLEQADSFYVILQGRAKVYKLSPWATSRYSTSTDRAKIGRASCRERV